MSRCMMGVGNFTWVWPWTVKVDKHKLLRGYLMEFKEIGCDLRKK